MIRRYTTYGFADRLKKAMSDKNVSKEGLAKKMKTDRKTIRGWTDGVREPRAVMLADLCVALDISADYLLFGVEKN